MQFQITEVTGSRKVVISTKNLKELKEKVKEKLSFACPVEDLQVCLGDKIINDEDLLKDLPENTVLIVFHKNSQSFYKVPASLQKLTEESPPLVGEDARQQQENNLGGIIPGVSSKFLQKHTLDSQLLQSKELDNHLSKPSTSTPPSEEKPAAKGQEDVHGLCHPSRRKKFVQNNNEVEVQRNDPSSPLHSVKSFEELSLSEQLRRGVYDMGFNKPSKIQETALPMLLADPPYNMIAQSQSGTGKTAAFVLSMLSRVDATKKFTQVICLSPTNELALQTGQVAEKMGKFCPEVKIGYAVRGEKVSRGQKVADHILFGTPGTLFGWILRHHVIDPKKIKMFVLDEADVMIALQGHHDQSIRIHKTLPKDCQMLLFSATYDEEVMKFATTVVPDPLIIRQRPKEKSVKQFYVVCQDKEAKFQALSNMYGVVSIGQCIVFCHTCNSASWLAQKMTEDGHAVALLSGEITVEQRIAVLNRFRDGKEKLLITTSVCARAVDVEQVTVVVNYDMPVEPTGKPDFETYQHRIDRTGSVGKSGIAVNFIDGQRSMAVMKKLEERFGKKILLLQTSDLDALEQLNKDTFFK